MAGALSSWSNSDRRTANKDEIRSVSPGSRYLWPTNASRSLASSFAETRANHFHFGIDIRTQQRTGFPCYAVADGYVTRVKVSPYGYGRVLYLQLDDSHQAVYAHLKNFAPAVEKLVHAEQMRQKTFRCELFLQPQDLPFKKGDVLACTGSSGVGSPHLHFEMRDAQGYCNPCLLGFVVDDTLPPVPSKLAVCPLDIHGEVNGDVRTSILPLTATGARTFKVSPVPTVYGPIGLEISGYDQVDGSGNSMSFYGLDLYLDGEPYFSTRYDHFDYYDEKQIDLDRDYRLRKKTGNAFHHLWKDPSTSLSFYKKGDGVIDTRDFAAGFHDYEIVLCDFAANQTRITGRLQFGETPRCIPAEGYSNLLGFLLRAPEISLANNGANHSNPGLTPEFFEDFILFSLPFGSGGKIAQLNLLEPYVRLIPLVRWNDKWIGKLPLQPFSAGDWTVEIRRQTSDGGMQVDSAAWCIQPVKTSGGSVSSEDGQFQAAFDKNAVYRTLYARVITESAPAESTFVSRAYHLEPDDMPIKGNVQVSIAIPITEKQPEKLGIYGLSPKGVWKFLDNDRAKVEKFVTGASPRLERYVLRRDLSAPRVGWLSPALSTNQKRPTFKLSVRDDLSGFDDRSINLEVDGQFVLMEYDPEAGTIFGSPDEALTVGNHPVSLSLRDFCGNETHLAKSLKITR